MGFVFLESGGEFKVGMAAADKRAIAVCSGPAPPVRIINRFGKTWAAKLASLLPGIVQI